MSGPDRVVRADQTTRTGRATRATEVLPRDGSSPRRARTLVVQALHDAGHDGEQVALARLLTSELATNAVRHGSGGSFTVEVVTGSGTATVRVHDDDPRPPTLRAPDGHGHRPGGWGLDLVDRLSQAWGSEPSGAGKVVWFTLGSDGP